MPATLEQLKQKRDALVDRLGAFMGAVKSKTDDGTKYDFRAATTEHGVPEELVKLEGTEKSARVAEWFQEQNDELTDLAKEVETIEAGEKAAEEYEAREKQVKRRPLPGSNQKADVKTFGERITEHKRYKNLMGGQSATLEFPDMRLLTEEKATFETTAGWAPESTRTGVVVDAVTRPLQVVDIMPSIPTGQAAVVYMEETTRTHGATEIAEDGAYPEDTFVLTERTSTVRKIGSNIPATDEQLADVPFASSYLDARIRFGVRQRLDGQIIGGDGIAPNLEGIENVTGIQTQALGGDPVPDAFFKAMVAIRFTGRAMPTHHVMLPSDWQGIRLTRTADGIYIWGNPSEAGPERLWGLPVVQNESLTATTGLVGSFELSWIYLAERAGVTVQSGFINDDFTDGRQRLRAQGRWALVVARPAAFCQVTGI